MQNVNLLDRRRLPPQPLVRTATVAACLAAAAMAVLVHAAHEFEQTRRALAATGGDAAAPTGGEAVAQTSGASGNDPAQAPLSRLRTRLAEREALLAALRSQAELPTEPAQTLRDVLGALPETMWLTEVNLLGARELRLAGGTLDPSALAEFAQRLGGTASLRGVGLQTVQLRRGHPTTAPGAPGAGEGQAEPVAGAEPMHAFVLASETTAAGVTP